MGQVIAVVNQKGGVGKTTTAINVSAGLALLDQRVLLVDFDPQSNSTRGLGYGPDQHRGSIYDVISGEARLEQTYVPTGIDRMTLVPSEPDLIGVEVELMNAPRRETRLRDALEDQRPGFDQVFIDCPPSLSLLTLNALVAADSVLVPVQCEYLALEGVTLLIETLRRVKASLNPDLRIQGILLTMYDERTNLSKQVADDIRGFFQGSAYDTVIPRSVRLGEAPSHGQSIFQYDPRSKGAESYFSTAREFLQREQSHAISRDEERHEEKSPREGTQFADSGPGRVGE